MFRSGYRSISFVKFTIGAQALQQMEYSNMTGRRVLCCAVALLSAVFLVRAAGSAQERQKLTVEWLYSPEAMEATATAQFKWLSNGKALLYDRRRGQGERKLETLDAATGERSPQLDMGKSLGGLKAILGEQSPRALPFPPEIDAAGKRGLYVLGGDVFLLDLVTGMFSRVTDTPGEEKCASFSPNGAMVSYVRANNLFVYDIEKRSERQLTMDGSDSLLNGTLSWVYWEEIFGRHDIGYTWSGEGKSIAFLRTNESGVSIDEYVDFKPWTPRVLRQRYPKVGEKNPEVRAGIVDVQTGKITWVDVGGYEYLVRLKWLPDDRRLAVETMNRLQTELSLFFVDKATGKGTAVLRETDDGWVNISDDLYFLNDGKHFLWSSERDGYKHLYRYSLDGRLVNQVTRGNWAMRSGGGGVAWVDQAVTGIDEKAGWIYFTALEKSSIEHHLYRVRMDGSGMTRLTREDGTHAVTFSPDAKYYMDRYSAASVAPSLSLHRNDGSVVSVVSAPRTEQLAKFDLQYPSFFAIPARDGFPLPAQIVKPKDFDAGKKYPVIFFVYGGPSAPQVSNSWQRDVYWENILAANGYLVARCDPRNATAISKTLENTVARHLMGEVELNDLVDAARWMKRQSYVDSSRIGVWGWSGGGSYTLLGMTRSTEFKAGIAVAGVTDVRFYDSKWGEAVMKTEKENKEGLDAGSLLRYAKDLSGKLLIVHGTYDDNVHIQNTWAFIDELIRANKRFELMAYPMRMHGISDTPARIHLYSTMLDFWKRNL
jgi:dipeptidyl-peptidase 4